ncbi:hypothetical protein M9H77_36626 [Catharanthus roseus]|uniref:Uncharacterized protein n=1 Tax=Catharanthus roseus TaxID=4058 RepID=A0ACB9ZUX1_CATRO|nr:hypothetical protein M9H77_36626 [Catharanthus roseus]
MYLVENQFDKKIKISQCDGDREFNSNQFLNHTSDCEPTTSATFTVNDITPTVNSNTPVVNYAPAGTSTLSPDSADTVDDDGITVNTDNDPTVDIGMLSTDDVDTDNSGELTVDIASPTVDVAITQDISATSQP